MVMKYWTKTVFLFGMIAFFTNCQTQQIDEDAVGVQNQTVALSKSEYLSVANDHPRELSEYEIHCLLNNFAAANLSSRRASSIKYKSLLKYYLSGTDGKKDNDSIPVLKVSVNNCDIAYLSIDSRYPKVIAYLPNDVDSIRQNMMLTMSEYGVKNQICYIERLKDSLKESTIDKLRNKLRVWDEDFDFDKIKGFVSVKDGSDSRAPVIENVPGQVFQTYGPFLDTKWDTGSPYNGLMPEVSCSDLWWTDRYPVGVVAVAAAQLLAYYEPALSAEKYIMDWKYLKEKSTIVEPDYFNAGDPLKKREMVAALMKYCSDRCGITYNCTACSYNMDKVRSFLSGFGIIMDNPVSFDVSKIKSSIADVQMVLCHGSTSSGSGHSWIIDGYINTKSGSLYYETDVYLHANMCMGNSGTGYYLVNSDNTITFNTGFAELVKDMFMYANIRM